MKCEEAQELITGLVDKELSGAEGFSIESHLKECFRCRATYERERNLKRAIREAVTQLGAPAELRSKILSDQSLFPAADDSGESWKQWLQSIWSLPRAALAFVLIVILMLPVFYWLRVPNEPFSLAALQIQQRITAGRVSLHKTANPAELRKWMVHAAGGRFAPMEYDLASMGVQPEGGLVEQIDGRKMLVTVYAGKDLSITCFTFLGTENDAPKDARIVFDRSKKIKFYTFSKQGFNAVLHREGDVICLLISKISMEKLLTIATAKSEST
jgi:anti-sigma factor RsiW